MNGIVHSSAFAPSRSNDFVFAPVRGRKRAKSFELVLAARAGIPMGMQPPEYIPVLVTDELAFLAWIDQAMPGGVLEYHRGFLALDVCQTGSRLCEPDRTELLKLSHRAMWGAERGLVHLVQRRNGLENFSYLAIARPRPRGHPACLCSPLLQQAA